MPTVAVAVAVPEMVGAVLPDEGAVETGVSGEVCADVDPPELPPPPQAASSEERTTEQQAKRIHEPVTVLIVRPHQMTQPGYRAEPSSQPWRGLCRFRVVTATSDLDRGSGFAVAGTKPAQVLLQHTATGITSATCVPYCPSN